MSRAQETQFTWWQGWQRALHSSQGHRAGTVDAFRNGQSTRDEGPCHAMSMLVERLPALTNKAEQNNRQHCPKLLLEIRGKAGLQMLTATTSIPKNQDPNPKIPGWLSINAWLAWVWLAKLLVADGEREQSMQT
ncbi:hypothetical protein E4U43_000384 [Claviceps pusilla]|uniref:Uncharacterized protein n=1 Tax=Claviceps pusilla TaxID=123648 RepID=A0A9P7T073_9HYPO|nr:hypothetical protein E4U43_000384 [Claviceps pusilla]